MTMVRVMMMVFLALGANLAGSTQSWGQALSPSVCTSALPDEEAAFRLVRQAGLADHRPQVPYAFWVLPFEEGNAVRLDFKTSLHNFGTEYRFLNTSLQLAGEVFYRPWNNAEMNPWTKDHGLKMVFVMAVIPGKDPETGNKVLAFLVYDYLVSNTSGTDVPVGLWRNEQVVPLPNTPPS